MVRSMPAVTTDDSSGRRKFLATAVRAFALLFVAGGLPGCAKESRHESNEPGIAASNGDPYHLAYEAALSGAVVVEEGIYDFDPSVGSFVRVGTLRKRRCGPASSPSEPLRWNC